LVGLPSLRPAKRARISAAGARLLGRAHAAWRRPAVSDHGHARLYRSRTHAGRSPTSEPTTVCKNGRLMGFAHVSSTGCGAAPRLAPVHPLQSPRCAGHLPAACRGVFGVEVDSKQNVRARCESDLVRQNRPKSPKHEILPEINRGGSIPTRGHPSAPGAAQGVLPCAPFERRHRG
jgi:hypothetical protein